MREAARLQREQILAQSIFWLLDMISDIWGFSIFPSTYSLQQLQQQDTVSGSQWYLKGLSDEIEIDYNSYGWIELSRVKNFWWNLKIPGILVVLL